MADKSSDADTSGQEGESDVQDSGDDSNDEDDGDDSDLESDDSTEADEDESQAPLQKPRNQLLAKIIQQLDGPSAVCLGLKCKQFYVLVSAVCKRSLGDICPRNYNFRSECILVQPYDATEEDEITTRYAALAIKMVEALRSDLSTPARLLEDEYIGLMRRLTPSSLMCYLDPEIEHCSTRYGHYRLAGSRYGEPCPVCFMIKVIKASQEVHVLPDPTGRLAFYSTEEAT